jgi:hypothetical protein
LCGVGGIRFPLLTNESADMVMLPLPRDVRAPESMTRAMGAFLAVELITAG